MPDYVLSNGQTNSIPGVSEFTETVILNQPGPTPPFMVPVIVGGASSGIPYNFDSLKQDQEAAVGGFRQQRTSAIVQDTWGMESDIAVAFRNAQAAGLPMAFITTVSALTRAKVLVTSTGPVTEGTLYSRLFGAVGGDHKVKWASGVMTITPVKRYAMLSAAVATTDRRIYVKGNDPNVSPVEWVTPGQTLYLSDNDTTAFAVVVASSGAGRELNSDGQWQYYIDLTAAAGTAVEISTKYGRVVLYDDIDEVSPTFSSGEGQKLVDWINTNSKVLAYQKSGTFSGTLPITVSSSTPLKEISAWGTATVGTSPAPTDSDWNTFFTNYKATYWNQFREVFGVTPYIHLLLTSSSTAHGYAKTFANDCRKASNIVIGFSPVSILLGAGYTDTSTSAGDSTDLTYRARNLNYQDVLLFGGQMGRLAPYLGLAADAFGQFVAGGSIFSITKKPIQFSQECTKLWDETNSGQLTTLIKAGVITYMFGASNPPVWQYTQGCNTNQDRTVVWSSSTNTSCLSATRNAMNEFDSGLRTLLDTAYPGEMGVEALEAGMAVSAYCTTMRDKRRLITAFRDPTIEVDANTGRLNVTNLPVTPIAETLFVGVNVQIFPNG